MLKSIIEVAKYVSLIAVGAVIGYQFCITNLSDLEVKPIEKPSEECVSIHTLRGCELNAAVAEDGWRKTLWQLDSCVVKATYFRDSYFSLIDSMTKNGADIE